MADERYSLELSGCAPIPLAHYLKALGILRLVSEQVDKQVGDQAQGWWEGDTFFLRSSLDRDGLVEFFQERYAPTPLVGPWGARSGFFAAASEKTAREALEAIAETDSGRLAGFRLAIRSVHLLLKQLGLQTKAENDEEKLCLLKACRAYLPDELLQWLDTTYVLLNGDRAFPPLLGTGGNEGSGSYMSGFAQQVVAVLIDRTWDDALLSSVFADPQSGTTGSQAPGHFSPEATGGPNAGSGFDGSVGMNPWDYLLALEGSLLFAASCAKKLESHGDGSLAYPFCVRPVGAGYGSASMSDATVARAEMWFPLWERPASYSELMAFLSEGRAVVNRRPARDGIDFARAVAATGIDRGVKAFERYGFHQRNGLSYFAVPLGRFAVREDPAVEELLTPIDRWLDRFRPAASSKNAPGRAGRALRQLEAAIFELCQRGEPTHVQNVLISLGQAEAAVAISPKLRDPKEKGNVSPVPQLSPQWLSKAYLVGSKNVEFRLAAALAGIGYGKEDKLGPFRRHVEPVDPKALHKWSESADDPGLVWGGGDLIRNMLAVLNRRMIDAVRCGKQSGDDELLFPGEGRCHTSLADIAAFIDGHVDDRRIESLLRGLILVNWRQDLPLIRGPAEPTPDAAYALLKLCHLPHKIAGKAVRLTPAITRRASSGDLVEATRLAARRLAASGFPPAVKVIHGCGERARRIAAALLFPVWHKETVKKCDVTRLMDLVLPVEDRSESAGDPAEAADITSAAV